QNHHSSLVFLSLTLILAEKTMKTTSSFLTQEETTRRFAVIASKRNRALFCWPTGMACVSKNHSLVRTVCQQAGSGGRGVPLGTRRGGMLQGGMGKGRNRIYYHRRVRRQKIHGSTV